MDNRYVSKEEVRPYRNFFDQLVKKIRPLLRNDGIKFYHRLVGSAKRNLVIRHHNKGFDCDYQIFITKNKKDLSELEIKSRFIDYFNKYLERTKFNNCENKTTAITIKEVDKIGSKIHFSYDVVILKIIDDEMFIIKQSDENKHLFHWTKLPDMKNSYDNFKKIVGTEMWKELRDEYYYLKTNNNNNLKSFQLLNQAVSKVISNKKYHS